MRLATLKKGGRDGTLVVVTPDAQHYAAAGSVAATLQQALDRWAEVEPQLRALAEQAAAGKVELHPLSMEDLASPLPRAYEWVDGSAFLSHVELVRKARGAEVPPTLRTDPLVYQGGSGVLLGPREPIPLPDESWGLDLEAEVVVILKDTPRGTRADQAAEHVALITLVNDITLRNLVPAELKKGFGFVQGKPASAFGPFAVTPDELGDAFRDGRVHLPLVSRLNEELLGDPEAGDAMHFSFYDLIAHIARTRSFTAGTLLGSGTVANYDPARGSSCLAERRMREILDHGEPRTPFLKRGDRVRIHMADAQGRDIFGEIDQRVVE